MTRFRLPTEADRERAARGGSTTRFSFGNSIPGNDAEWAEDRDGPYPETPQADPTGPPEGAKRVLRGSSPPRNLSFERSTSRTADDPRGSSGRDGFRLAWSP